MDDLQTQFIHNINQTKLKLHSRNQSLMDSKDHDNQLIYSRLRSQSQKWQIQYFPIYMVRHQDQRPTSMLEKKANNYELKDFYRAKDSPAEIQIGKNPEVLRRLDTKYYTKLYWAIDANAMPYMEKFM